MAMSVAAGAERAHGQWTRFFEFNAVGTTQTTSTLFEQWKWTAPIKITGATWNGQHTWDGLPGNNLLHCRVNYYPFSFASIGSGNHAIKSFTKRGLNLNNHTEFTPRNSSVDTQFVGLLDDPEDPDDDYEPADADRLRYGRTYLYWFDFQFDDFGAPFQTNLTTANDKWLIIHQLASEHGPPPVAIHIHRNASESSSYRLFLQRCWKQPYNNAFEETLEIADVAPDVTYRLYIYFRGGADSSGKLTVTCYENGSLVGGVYPTNRQNIYEMKASGALFGHPLAQDMFPKFGVYTPKLLRDDLNVGVETRFSYMVWDAID